MVFRYIWHGFVKDHEQVLHVSYGDVIDALSKGDDQ